MKTSDDLLQIIENNLLPLSNKVLFGYNMPYSYPTIDVSVPIKWWHGVTHFISIQIEWIIYFSKILLLITIYNYKVLHMHDNNTVVLPCAKFCSGLLIRIRIIAKLSFHWNWISKENLLVKWQPRSNCTPFTENLSRLSHNYCFWSRNQHAIWNLGRK